MYYPRYMRQYSNEVPIDKYPSHTNMTDNQPVPELPEMVSFVDNFIKKSKKTQIKKYAILTI